MDVREKLVELQLKADIEDETSENTTQHREYIAELMIAQGVTVQEWIPVTERSPIEEAKAYEQECCEEYPEFLVMIDRGLLPTTLYYDWENNEWFRINTALKREKYKVTHWMTLPEPPKEVE